MAGIFFIRALQFNIGVFAEVTKFTIFGLLQNILRNK
jgi:hypothetical protein